MVLANDCLGWVLNDQVGWLRRLSQLGSLTKLILFQMGLISPDQDICIAEDGMVLPIT